MSSLLGRFAENIFWIGRYVERVENTARILQINETYARDDREGPDWRRILDLYSDTERFLEVHDDASASKVLAFYILNRDNPTSIASAVAAARENARTVRHLLSTEMWSQINVFHSSIKELSSEDITLSKLSKTTSDLILGCQAYDGIASGTLLRGEPWSFYCLGKYLERADQTTRVLDVGYKRLPIREPDAVTSVRWNALLRSLSGYHAFRSRHPSASQPRDIVSFLLYDDEFPRAVALCVSRVTEGLRDLDKRYDAPGRGHVEIQRRALEFALETGPGSELTSERLHVFLDGTQQLLAKVATSIGEAYFGHAPTFEMRQESHQPQ